MKSPSSCSTDERTSVLELDALLLAAGGHAGQRRRRCCAEVRRRKPSDMGERSRVPAVRQRAGLTARLGLRPPSRQNRGPTRLRCLQCRRSRLPDSRTTGRVIGLTCVGRDFSFGRPEQRRSSQAGVALSATERKLVGTPETAGVRSLQQRLDRPRFGRHVLAVVVDVCISESAPRLPSGEAGGEPFVLGPRVGRPERDRLGRRECSRERSGRWERD
jgi:hypothetical protein